MSDLTGQLRQRVGKGAARELRRNKMVPAVIYGDSKEPVSIALPYKELQMAIYGGGFMATVLELDIEGEKYSVLPKDYQLDPVRDFPVHVDFLRVGRRTRVTLEIPVNFLNEDASPGLSEGGVLNVVRHTVEVSVQANKIPEGGFDVDLTGYNQGDSINASAIDKPEEVEFTITDRDFTLATIAAPAGLASQDDDDTEAPAADEVPTLNGDGPDAEAENVNDDAKSGDE